MLGFTLSSARWPEVEAGPRRLLVVPLGSLEQHGPHLPMDTDSRIAYFVASRACAGRAGVGLAPPVAIGASGEHADFPGTLSIGTTALALLLVELGRHASLHWPAMLLVNGHGGNVPAVAGAVRRLRAEGRDCHAWHAGLPGHPAADPH
ncbi:MAG TPA: creatininase family protein, partial [Streptosporangiaceae bacterium]|nr:creatininase family protein [Streptosporangiaceae bacterium]